MYRRCISAKKIINIDFGQVEVGTISTKSVKILNESCKYCCESGVYYDLRRGFKDLYFQLHQGRCVLLILYNEYRRGTLFLFNKEQIYEVRRDPTTNPMDYVFNLCAYTWTLCPEELYSCDIFYRPLVSSVENVDYFIITDSSGICIEVIARGYSIGPDVSVSMNKVVMICPDRKSCVKKYIKLVNKSKTNATFMFDICNTTAPFLLDVTHGMLGHDSEKYVTITFTPEEEGVYTYHLACLIHYQNPIIIELHGVCGKLDPKKMSILYKEIDIIPAKNGFEGYMNDSTNILIEGIPPISLSKNYFNFSSISTNTGSMYGSPQVICLTNNSEKTVLIKWGKDVKEVFHISPETAHVQPTQCALFEISFSPPKKNSLFAKEFVGSIFYANKKEHQNNTIAIPSCVYIRVTGHSFPLTSDGWIPQHEIPQTVTMPPCLPLFPTYTTFLINAYGHLPLMFRFLPPCASHFTVKPMLGVINQNCQIIVVKMNPEVDSEQAYMERWVVQFNGNSKNQSYIYFRGYAEYANIKFSNNNSVGFRPTLVGCQRTEQLVMRNITRHKIKYWFEDIPPTLQVQRISGEISSNSILSHNWIITSDKTGYFNFKVHCVMTVVHSEILSGSSIRVPLSITARFETGYLVAMPNDLNFGDQLYGQTMEQSFHVFNFSSVNINFKLICVHRGWPLGNINDDVKMRPVSDTVYPGKSEKITVSITPRTPGFYQLAIKYLVHRNSQTEVLVSGQCPKLICQINCMCVLPTFEIKDIHCYGSSKVASRAFLWQMMKINDINAALKNLLPGEEKLFYIDRHSMMLTKQPVYIKLLLLNTTRVSADWIFKRVQLCSCKPILKTRGISFRYYEYECEHRNVCFLYPKSGCLNPKEDVMITIELHYILSGPTDVKWEFNIGCNRRIYISMTIDALSGDERYLTLLYGTHLKFESIYIGEKEPIYQICWVHNHMNYSLPYSVDRTGLQIINQIYYNELFACMTPHGVVEGNTIKPIIFKFQPRQFGKYEVNVPLTLGNYKVNLSLEGKASVSPDFLRRGDILPLQSTHKRREIPVYFSVNSLDVFPMSTHNRVVKILLIHNHSAQDIITYEWKRYDIPGILLVRFYPEKSTIQPYRTQSVRVTILSAGCPCRININIPCEFLNASKRREYQKNAFKYLAVCNELKDQFVITEQHTSIPEPLLMMHEEPEPFIKVLSVRCLIYGSENEELYSTAISKLKCPPQYEVNLTETLSKSKAMDQISIPLLTLEGILWNIVSDKTFKHIMSNTVLSPTNLYYSQFCMDICKRRNLETRARIGPPRKLLEEIFGRMLFIIIHEEFAMETIHFIKQTDIRNVNYLRLVSRPNKATEHDEGYTATSLNLGVGTDSVFTVTFAE